MKRLYYKPKRYLEVPESYAEITRHHLVRLAPLLFRGGEEVACQVQALRILTGSSWLRFRLMSADAIRRALPFVEWVFDGNKATRQLLPYFRGRYGPAAEFENLRMHEWHAAERYYRLVIDGRDEHLANLVATLYRPGRRRWINPHTGRRERYPIQADPSGDRREPFNHNLVERQGDRIRSWWPLSVQQAVYLWYDACRQQLIDRNPLPFEKSKDGFDSQFEIGAYGMIRALAGEKHGPVERVQEMHVLQAMLELGLIKEEEAYIESKYPKP